jgi:iron-sulfur cluster repair protein YtfE (RIC family)
MKQSKHSVDLAGAAQHLHDDHHAFTERFDNLCDRARSGDWHELDEVWSSFTADLEAHLAFEEAQLFPGFGAQGAACRVLVRRLCDQHVEFRELLASIGLQIQLKEIRPATIETFTALMRDHAALESDTIYPWAGRAAHSESSSSDPRPA